MRYDVGRFRRPMRRSTEGQLMSLISLGDGSTLSLDFTTGVLDPRLTFTRASGGTYVANDGYIYGMDFATSSSLAIGTGSKSVTLTATAGVDRRYLVGQTVYISNGANNMSGPVTAYNASTQVLTINATATSGSGSFTSWAVGNASPRFDHDPTTGAPRGLLIEGTATNLVTQSNGSTSVWGTGGNRTPTNNTTDLVSPDGTNNATKLVCGSAGAYASFATSISGLTGGATYTISYWIRGPVGHSPRLYAQNGTIGDVTATATTGTYNNTGWTRLTQTYTLPAATTQCLVYFLSANIGTTGDTFYVYGFQMETGSGASSHIPTGASTVQRLRDEVVLSSLPGIAFNQSAGTIYSQLEIVEKLRGSFVPYGSFDTSGGGRCWWWLRHNHDASVGQRILGTAFNSGGSTAITSSNYTHSSGVFKFATSLDPVAGRMVYAIAGGSAQVTNASGFTLATAAQMSLNKNNDVAATDLGSMWVRTIKYWPTALPDATLQSMTT